MSKTEIYIGLDVHKETITASVAEGGRNGEVRQAGTISNDLRALEKLLRRIGGGQDGSLHVCYEAGPCGFVIARRLKQLGMDCTVVAPSLIPTKAGDRIKTDKRDAEKLARLLRAGDLSAVYVPDCTDEAIRDLCRARTDAVDDRTRARQRLKAFLLRNGLRYTAKSTWNEAHMRYLRELVLPHPAMKVILEDYLCAIDAAGERVKRCEEAMGDLLVSWQLRPAVEALMGFKGFKLVAAMITVSELGDIHRFAHPRQLMAYLGLVPTEATSSDKRKQGGAFGAPAPAGAGFALPFRQPVSLASRRVGSKCGNPHARWLLVECSQHYETPPKVSKELSMRQVKLDRRAREVSWRAQNRLHSRFNRLRGRRLQRNKAMTAVARELTGFIWELLRELPCYTKSASAQAHAL